MKLKWLGTAGFQVDTGGQVFLIDPYFSRNPKAKPVQTLQPGNISDAGHIFLTHGHFDHIYDIPSIMAHGAATVYCSEIAAGTLVREGVDKGRIHIVKGDAYKVDFDSYKAEAFFSRHIKFDKELMEQTLLRIGPDYHRLGNMHSQYPAGQVLSWRFTFGRFTMHHFGSGGSTPEELARLATNPLDVLMIPLQGHTHICDIAFEYVRELKPHMVIPHHQDDFYPPLSTYVDIAPFVKAVKERCPSTEVRVMAMNETITL